MEERRLALRPSASASRDFDRAGIDISGSRKALPTTARALEAARKAGIKVIYLKMAYQPDLSDLGESDSVNRVRHLQLGVGQHVTAPDGRPSRVLVRDAWSTDIIDELKPESGDVVLYKTRFSGFTRRISTNGCASSA